RPRPPRHDLAPRPMPPLLTSFGVGCLPRGGGQGGGNLTGSGCPRSTPSTECVDDAPTPTLPHGGREYGCLPARRAPDSALQPLHQDAVAVHRSTARARPPSRPACRTSARQAEAPRGGAVDPPPWGNAVDLELPPPVGEGWGGGRARLN